MKAKFRGKNRILVELTSAHPQFLTVANLLAPMRYERVGQPHRYEYLYHGPTPPAPDWVYAGVGPKGGKRWKPPQHQAAEHEPAPPKPSLKHQIIQHLGETSERGELHGLLKGQHAPEDVNQALEELAASGHVNKKPGRAGDRFYWSGKELGEEKAAKKEESAEAELTPEEKRAKRIAADYTSVGDIDRRLNQIQDNRGYGELRAAEDQIVNFPGRVGRLEAEQAALRERRKELAPQFKSGDLVRYKPVRGTATEAKIVKVDRDINGKETYETDKGHKGLESQDLKLVSPTASADTPYGITGIPKPELDAIVGHIRAGDKQAAEAAFDAMADKHKIKLGEGVAIAEKLKKAAAKPPTTGWKAPEATEESRAATIGMSVDEYRRAGGAAPVLSEFKKGNAYYDVPQEPKVKTGDIVEGFYNGIPFRGTVHSIESDQSDIRGADKGPDRIVVKLKNKIDSPFGGGPMDGLSIDGTKRDWGYDYIGVGDRGKLSVTPGDMPTFIARKVDKDDLLPAPAAQPDLSPPPKSQQNLSAQESADVPDILLANTYAGMFRTGHVDKDALWSAADAAYGGTRAEGKYGPSDAYDALEAGFNKALVGETNPSVMLSDAVKQAASIAGRIDKLPTQTNRSGTKEALQQFSTPPHYAYAVTWLANLKPTDVVLEPSAGTGCLAIQAANSGAAVYCNEIDPRRAEFLKDQFGADHVLVENAEYISSILPRRGMPAPTAVVMNPPFSQTAGRMGDRKDLHTAEKHIEEGLRSLAPGGRLVAIVGRGMTGDSPTHKPWFRKIAEKYDIRANIGVDGSVYKKYGTQFDNRVLVIDKVAPGKDKEVPNDGPMAPKPPNVGFTGTTTDSLGRTYHWVNGKRVRGPAVTGDVKTVTELMQKLEGVRNDRPEAAGPPSQPTSDPAIGGIERDAEQLDSSATPVNPGVSEEGPASPEATEQLLAGPGGSGGATGDTGPGGSGGAVRGGLGDAPVGVEPTPGEQPGGAETGVVDAPEGAPGRPLPEPGSGKRKRKSNSRGNGKPAGGQPVPESVPFVSQLRPAELIAVGNASPEELAAKKERGELGESLYEAYHPALMRIQGMRPHTDPIVESAAMAGIRPPKATYQPTLSPDLIAGKKIKVTLPDGTVEERDAGLSEVALETIVYMGQAHQRFLPAAEGETPYRRGMLCGDLPGTGKGRMIAGTILDNWNQGRKKHVWITQKQKLFADAKRDWADLGNDANNIVHFDDIRNNPAPPSEGICFITYDTLKGKDKKDPTGPSNLDKLLAWLGPDFDGVIAFDEAHTMGNALDVGGDKVKVTLPDGTVTEKTSFGIGSKQASQNAMAGLELQKKAPKARVGYFSATPATEVRNLTYGDRLGIWGYGTDFPDKKAFVAEMDAGGVAAMEAVAQSLKATGSLNSRSLSYDGVENFRLSHNLTDEQRFNYDVMAKAWQKIFENMEKAIESLSGGSKKASKAANAAAASQFWGAEQRFFNSVLTSMQMPTIIANMKKDLEEGRSPVLYFTMTGEATIKKTLAGREEGQSIEDLDFSPKQTAIAFLTTCFPTHKREEYQTEDGNVGTRIAMDSEGHPIEDPEAAAIRDEMIAMLDGIRIPEAPLDQVINEFGQDDVAEATGRSKRLVWEKDENGVLQKVQQNRGDSAASADIAAFKNGKKRIMLLSNKYGTGFSYHAERGIGNQRQRAFYAAQPGWRADNAVQAMGRVNRTNQTSKPVYNLCEVADIPGHRRFVSSIARRLDQLGSLGRGQRQSGSSGLFKAKDNLESNEAQEALLKLYMDMRKGKIPELPYEATLKKLGLLKPREEGDSQPPLPKASVTQFLNRLLAVEVGEQHTLFDAFDQRLTGVVEQAMADGTLDTGIENFPAQKLTKKDATVVFRDPESGAETHHVVMTATNKAEKRPWAKNAAASGFVVNKRSGKIWAVYPAADKTEPATGRVVPQYHLYGPGGDQFLPTWDVANKFDEVRPEQNLAGAFPSAEEIWSKQHADIPDTYETEEHFLTGAMLPIWGKIPGKGKVYRVLTAKGNVFAGRQVPRGDVHEMLKNLGVHVEESHGTEDVHAKLSAGRGKARMANGWRLQPAMVQGERRIELVGPGPYYHPSLEKDGIIKEKIGSQYRLFVPMGDDGAKVLDKITKSNPITEHVEDQPQHYAKSREELLAAIASAEKEVADPTPGQAKAGNYAKGHFWAHGLDITIETPAGKRRRPEWPPLANSYGYIRGTEGADAPDQVDVFIGPHPESEVVFVVDQVKADGRFDEHKCLIGFFTTADAKAAYLANYAPGWKGLGAIHPMTMAAFKLWLADGDTRKRIEGQEIPHQYAKDLHTLSLSEIIDRARMLGPVAGRELFVHLAEFLRKNPHLRQEVSTRDWAMVQAWEQGRHDEPGHYAKFDESKIRRDEGGKFAHKAALESMADDEERDVGGVPTKRHGSTWRAKMGGGHIEGDADFVAHHIAQSQMPTRLEIGGRDMTPGAIAEKFAERWNKTADRMPEDWELWHVKDMLDGTDWGLDFDGKEWRIDHDTDDPPGRYQRGGVSINGEAWGESQPSRYEAAHAPKGGVTVQGTKYTGGEFIPGDVMARATTEEKQAVHGTANTGKSPAPAQAEPHDHAADYKANGTRAKAFKAWFGDWEADPANASKVVNAKGEPQETWETKKVYHGTSAGGFQEFNKQHTDENALFGPGFYFTEDRDVAESYTKVKQEGLTKARADLDKLKQDLASDEASGKQFHRGFYDQRIKVAEATLAKLHPEQPIQEEVKEAYLNIRKPFDIDKDEVTGRQLGLGAGTKFYADSMDEAISHARTHSGGMLGEVKRPDGPITIDTPMSFEAWRSYGIETGTFGKVEDEGESVTGVAAGLSERLQKLGYDGITHIGGDRMGGGHHHRVWIAFEPNQIKATQNRGTFDPNDNRLDYTREGDPARYSMGSDGLYHGPEAPGHNWVYAGVGPYGGKKWRQTAQSQPKQKPAPAFATGHGDDEGYKTPNDQGRIAAIPPAKRTSPMPSPTHADYHNQAMGNLAGTSRTAKGVVDTSASPGKAAKMAEGLTPEKAASAATQNFATTIKKLHDMKGETFSSPESVMSFVDSIAAAVNHGITKEGSLHRTDDSTNPDGSPKYPYTNAADLPLARKQFADELHDRLTNTEDPSDAIDTAGWIEWRLNFTDHLYADGVGKTSKALGAFALMRAGLPLPKYRSNAELFEHVNKGRYDPKAGPDSYKDAAYDKWQKYYRSLFRVDVQPGVRHIEEHAYPPANDKGVDTFERHQANGEWTPQREVLHAKIIEKAQGGIPPTPPGERTYLLMGGGPAAGKSSSIDAGVAMLPENHVMINSDDFKAELPEYAALLQDKDERAAGYAHEESSHLAKVIQEKSFAAGQNAVLDGTGDNSVDNVMKKVKAARAAGYKVNAEYVTCSTEEAVRRNDERAKKTGRKPAESMLRSVHKGVSQVLPELVKLGAFDNVRLWDSEHEDKTGKQYWRKDKDHPEGGEWKHPPTLVMSAQGGAMTVHKPELWDKFLAKADEDVGPKMGEKPTYYAKADFLDVIEAIEPAKPIEMAPTPDPLSPVLAHLEEISKRLAALESGPKERVPLPAPQPAPAPAAPAPGPNYDMLLKILADFANKPAAPPPNIVVNLPSPGGVKTKTVRRNPDGLISSVEEREE